MQEHAASSWRWEGQASDDEAAVVPRSSGGIGHQSSEDPMVTDQRGHDDTSHNS